VQTADLSQDASGVGHDLRAYASSGQAGDSVGGGAHLGLRPQRGR
jgi:hypothetical protein